MRVLHVVTHHSPDNVFGGPTRVAVNLCRGLRARGDRASLLTIGEGFDGPLPEEVDGVPAKVFRARRLIPGFGFSGVTSPALLARAGSYVRSADILHLHLARDLVTFPVALRALAARRPVVLQTHGMIDPTRVPAARIADALGVKRVLRRADALLYLTEAERDGVAAVTGPDSLAPAHRLVNGVPAQQARPPRAGDPPTVLFAARLDPRKRPADFVAAMPTVLKEHPRARFVMAGADPDGMAPGLLAQAARLGVADALEYLGALDHADVLERMRRSDVYVLPSVYEPFAMSALEALSVGLPAVLTRSGGVSADVVEAGAGRAVPNGEEDDPAANGERLGRAVLELLEPEEHRRASEAAWRLIRDRFTLDTVVDRLRTLYTGILAGRNGGPGPGYRT
ncbi:glycosyltransferase family 4 protein [Streptomyces sp. YIM 98790]|uniref:glycosyltransferase family 4 protein n=1 Tax=Streptomyces sp. YIM 98790 TaxID=2689077 RepID=UPI0014072D44|nr:glycosyltransferase family 4 protein [Streptomyces sp. YIM 98790]